MPSISKVTVLLADEDALRRDGLAAVLSSTQEFEVVASVGDGEAALAEVRARRPDVAVVDLNLPKMHGIEIIRRIRSEILGTKVVIMAGTDEDEIIREVVRAGGDGYLLKNGPARHLLDAISYVRDGGQYFSPQLRRDGRDRHLLEEPRRPVPSESSNFEAPAAESAGFGAANDLAERDYETTGEEVPRSDRQSRSKRSRRIGRRETASRVREEFATPGMDDRDHELMLMITEGIRPILDRLDDIDSRVDQMESGSLALPENPRRWLGSQLAESMGGRFGGRSGREVAREVDNLEAFLPEMIEEAVTKRFEQMSGKLQQELEDTHIRTLETFVKTVQTKIVKRVSALEQDMTRQAEAMNQLRESSARTEDNLSRLISGVDKLARDLPARMAERPQRESAGDSNLDGNEEPEFVRPPRRKGPPIDFVKLAKKAWVVVGVSGILGLLGWGAFKIATRGPRTPGTEASGALPAKPSKPAADADVKTKLLAAQEAADRKDYQMAEEIYRQVVKTEPANADALKGLASVLYRQDKIDEAAAVLDKIPKE